MVDFSSCPHIYMWLYYLLLVRHRIWIIQLSLQHGAALQPAGAGYRAAACGVQKLSTATPRQQAPACHWPMACSWPDPAAGLRPAECRGCPWQLRQIPRFMVDSESEWDRLIFGLCQFLKYCSISQKLRAAPRNGKDYLVLELFNSYKFQFHTYRKDLRQLLPLPTGMTRESPTHATNKSVRAALSAAFDSRQEKLDCCVAQSCHNVISSDWDAFPLTESQQCMISSSSLKGSNSAYAVLHIHGTTKPSLQTGMPFRWRNHNSAYHHPHWRAPILQWICMQCKVK
jgi:hypothetical protein